MIRTQGQLTEGQMSALKELAARRKVSVSELVRRGIDRILASQDEPTAAERRQRARAQFRDLHKI